MITAGKVCRISRQTHTPDGRIITAYRHCCALSVADGTALVDHGDGTRGYMAAEAFEEDEDNE